MEAEIDALVAQESSRRPSVEHETELYGVALGLKALGVPATRGVAALASVAKAWGATIQVKELMQMMRPPLDAPAHPNTLPDLLAAELNGTYSLVPWPFPVITARSRSLVPGSVTIVCGSPGGAKSWWVITCLRYWLDGVAPAGVLMLEETRAWHLKRVLTQLEGNPKLLDSDWCRFHPDEVMAAFERHRDAIDSVSARLWCEGNQTLDACAAWVEERCKEKCRVLVIDPITLADNGKDKPWDADRKFMSRVKVAIESAGASLILVTHPRKMQGGPQKAPLTMDDMAGGAAYSRAAASVIWLNGLEDNAQFNVVNADGRESLAKVHKSMRIMKARNSTGQHDVIYFRFHNLSFIEEGVAVKGQPAAAAPSAPRRSRAARLADKPTDQEDAFS